MYELRNHDDDRYSMIIAWDPRDNIFIVTVPELPGCRTHGPTQEDAVKRAEEAIELWVESAREWGDAVPPPRFFDVDGPNPPGWGD